MSLALSYIKSVVNLVEDWADRTSLRTVAGVLGLVSSAATNARPSNSLGCAGYTAKHVTQSATSLTATLHLAGEPCNVYGPDIRDLKLLVEYQTDSRIHVKIYDAAEDVYQIPRDVLAFPEGSNDTYSDGLLTFSYTESPFSFAVQRSDTKETLFNTSGDALVFEPQYVHLRTSLPTDPYIYGLGEDVDSFRRQTDNYKRTIYNVGDAFLPEHANLYSSHPIYLEMRNGSAHGVFLASSNGMDVFIAKTAEGQQYLEYNVIGGVLDFYFLAGPSPVDVGRQYAEVVGAPAEQAYWTYGFHQCKFGYSDVMMVAEVVTNYSEANIPVETIWSDIDYMNLRRTWTLDPDRFPIHKVRELVNYLHEHDQHYVVMVDPPISVDDPQSYDKLMESEAYFRNDDGSVFLAGMWPGATAFVDWFHPNAQEYWGGQLLSFFDAETGVDVDAMWIDMNEVYAVAWSKAAGLPPPPPQLRDSWRPLPGFPSDFQPSSSGSKPPKTLSKRKGKSGQRLGLPGRDLLNPPYPLGTVDGIIYGGTIFTDRHQYGGYAFYDTKNLFASSMMQATRKAMLDRRPNKRPLIISRSTFAGDGKQSGHWTGDNISSWAHYRISIRQNMEFAAIFQMPTIGADVCGFNAETWETLCLRWVALGAWYPFFRNHADIQAPFQEFYLWPAVADAARAAIKTRYQLLDYFYTEFHYQTVDGTPTTILPLFFVYPSDPNTLDIEMQFFYGSALLVSPVTDDESTSVTFYLPADTWYDFFTGEKLTVSEGTWVTRENVAYDEIPVHIRGGTVVPMRVDGANTTTQLRKLDFELIVAPGTDGTARGRLYLDDGESLEQDVERTSEISFEYDSGTKKLHVRGRFGYPTDVRVVRVRVLGEAVRRHGQQQVPMGTKLGRTVEIDRSLEEGFSVYLG